MDTMDDNTSDQAQANPRYWELAKPDWAVWNKVKQARLWQAAALACNIAPGNFQLFGSPQISRTYTRPPAQLEDLLSMAKGSIGAGGILRLIPNGEEKLEEREVNLSNFTAWVRTVPHTLPPEFPWQPEAMVLSNMNWPWGRHETQLLRKLAGAANKFWTQYDPDDPSTAPTNQQVSNWLKAEGVPARTAEIMATILRIDGLPSGPRK